jgi:hypothetical protein
MLGLIPGTPELAIGLAILLVFVGIVAWIYKAGGDRVGKKNLKEKVKANVKFKKLGEKWDKMGGLGGAVRDKLRKSKR